MKSILKSLAVAGFCLLVFGFQGQKKGLTVKEGLEVGDRAPEITMKNNQGEEISLSSLRGQVVLLDFWAGWCRPCRLENGTVIYVYEKFKNAKFKTGTGFTVYSVSLDTDPQGWRRAIEEDKLTWAAHVCDFKNWASPVVQRYGINGIPANFLLDENGIILARNLRGPDLENKLNSLIE